MDDTIFTDIFTRLIVTTKLFETSLLHERWLIIDSNLSRNRGQKRIDIFIGIANEFSLIN